jgi:hypothetical protein
VSSSQLAQDPDRVRSFGGYNTWQRFAQINPENVATVAALLRRDKPAMARGILYEADKPTTPEGILGGTTTSKSE